MPGPMMSKDPRSIQEVDGFRVVEINGNDLIAERLITLHFASVTAP